MSSVRVACGDAHPAEWTRGWGICLERGALCAARSSSQRASALNWVIANALAQRGRLIDLRHQGPEALPNIVRSLCWGPIRATPIAAAAAAAMNTSYRIVWTEAGKTPTLKKIKPPTHDFSLIAETPAPWQPLSRFDREQATRRLSLTEAPRTVRWRHPFPYWLHVARSKTIPQAVYMVPFWKLHPVLALLPRRARAGAA